MKFLLPPQMKLIIVASLCPAWVTVCVCLLVGATIGEQFYLQRQDDRLSDPKTEEVMYGENYIMKTFIMCTVHPLFFF
jgi:hypothetical protein